MLTRCDLLNKTIKKFFHHQNKSLRELEEFCDYDMSDVIEELCEEYNDNPSGYTLQQMVHTVSEISLYELEGEDESGFNHDLDELNKWKKIMNNWDLYCVKIKLKKRLLRCKS